MAFRKEVFMHKKASLLKWPGLLLALLVLVGIASFSGARTIAQADSVHTCHLVHGIGTGNTDFFVKLHSAPNSLLTILQGSGPSNQGYSLQCDGNNPYPSGCKLEARIDGNTPLERGNLVKSLAPQIRNLGLRCTP